jgi:two-component system LytT family sensor kinase
MKKAFLFLIIQALGFTGAYAQIKWSEYVQISPDGITGDSSKVGLISALRKGNDFFWSIREKSKHFYTIGKDPAFISLRPKDILARTTFDTARAQFFLHGVGPRSAYLYEYRVTEFPSNRVLVRWHPISTFTNAALSKASGMPKMAYLGGYRTTFGKMLIVDIRKTTGDQIIATSLVAWEAIKPAITNIYTSENLEEFLKKLQYPWAPVKQPSGFQASMVKLPSTDPNIVFLLKGEIFYKHQVQYQLVRNGDVYTQWRNNDYENSFVWVKDIPPGRYTIKIRFSAQPQNITEYRFEVEPSWYQTNLFRIIAGIFVAALLGAFLFLILFIRQRQKTKNEQFNKTKVQLELKAIYAQLNPHFVFNALSSIQGLINKRDIKGANDYLSDFARLMRESLNNSNKDEISLVEEIQTLNTYLRLEQLRFGFQYRIDVSPGINDYETNIPTLLLQPLIENAVKHGVSGLQQNGHIEIVFERNSDTMIVTVIDNGKGFNAQQSLNGFGLKLTYDRINLLNALNPEQQLTIAFNNSISLGTQVTLTFSQWFI